MTDTRGIAVKLVAAKVLTDRLQAYTADLKEQMAAMLDEGDRKTAALGNGTKCGTVTYTKGRVTARVVDDAALLAWVQANHPDEVVSQVRPSFLTALLDDAKKAGAAVSRETGELVPGVEVWMGTPYLSVKPDPAAVPALADAIRAGQLLALESGEQVTPE